MAAIPSDDHTDDLLKTLLLSVESVEVFLDALVGLAVHLASPPVSCGITVEYDRHPLTIFSSDAVAGTLDGVQYDAGDGPCLRAMRTGTATYLPEIATEPRWPHFTSQAVALGVVRSLSLPLIVEGQSVGAINFYSSHDDQTMEGEVRIRAERFAEKAATALLLAMRQLRQGETNRQLETALTSRSVIDQAMGIIMAQQACQPEAAFAVLRRHSQNNNIPLREVAADIVRRVGGA